MSETALSSTSAARQNLVPELRTRDLEFSRLRAMSWGWFIGCTRMGDHGYGYEINLGSYIPDL